MWHVLKLALHVSKTENDSYFISCTLLFDLIIESEGLMIEISLNSSMLNHGSYNVLSSLRSNDFALVFSLVVLLVFIFDFW